MMMAMMMAFSLCACGGESAEGGKKVVFSEPKEEDYEVINEYLIALGALDTYAETGEISFFEYDEETGTDKEWEGNFALERYYKLIQELDSVDKWIGTEYCADTRTRKEVLDSFTIVEDVLLAICGTSFDKLGRMMGTENYQWVLWEYNEDGTISRRVVKGSSKTRQIDDKIYEPDRDGTVAYTYNENGQIVKRESADYISTPQYDSNGNLIREMIEGYSGSYDVSYTYDEQNRVTKISYKGNYWQRDLSDEYIYTYDDNGNVLSEKSNYTKTEYVYNEKGVLISGTYYELDSREFAVKELTI